MLWDVYIRSVSICSHSRIPWKTVQTMHTHTLIIMCIHAGTTHTHTVQRKKQTHTRSGTETIGKEWWCPGNTTQTQTHSVCLHTYYLAMFLHSFTSYLTAVLLWLWQNSSGLQKHVLSKSGRPLFVYWGVSLSYGFGLEVIRIILFKVHTLNSQEEGQRGPWWWGLCTYTVTGQTVGHGKTVWDHLRNLLYSPQHAVSC